MKLVSRIKKVQEDLSALQEQCRELLAAKQVLILSHFLMLILCFGLRGKCLMKCLLTVSQVFLFKISYVPFTVG